jgi:hypothetical protein
MGRGSAEASALADLESRPVYSSRPDLLVVLDLLMIHDPSPLCSIHVTERGSARATIQRAHRGLASEPPAKPPSSGVALVGKLTPFEQRPSLNHIFVHAPLLGRQICSTMRFRGIFRQEIVQGFYLMCFFIPIPDTHGHASGSVHPHPGGSLWASCGRVE